MDPLGIVQTIVMMKGLKMNKLDEVKKIENIIRFTSERISIRSRSRGLFLFNSISFKRVLQD